MLLLPFARGSDLVVFDEDLQGCSLEGAVEGEGTWAHSRRSALGNALCLMSKESLFSNTKPGCLPRASTWHLPCIWCSVSALSPSCSNYWGNEGSQDSGFGAQFGLLKEKTQRVLWREMMLLPCM